ncbi:MAG TPA: nucleoside triphosphate pyrophosphohydrolase [Candidatus Sulfomarinibacteraceae bacterium]|nr:nucleoside triphosphate pyrophosphohydrolase [Candidatus Sulfomarinibacteraceae bacterium]
MSDAAIGSIAIVGLGPGPADLVTRRAWQLLKAADVVFLRTAHHPAVDNLPPEVQWRSFDHVYEAESDFSSVYRRITDEIVEQARAAQHVLYAVPGDPTVGEATTQAIIEAAGDAGIPVGVTQGVSFVEPTLAALQLDALNGLQLFDAITLAGYNHPPVNPDYPLLLGQVYSRLLANELKLALMAVYPDEHTVALVHAAGTAQQYVERLALYKIDRSEQIEHLTALYVPPRLSPSSLPALAEDVAMLRGPQGCPWDQEQTPQSLRGDFLEEMSEVLEALDLEDPQRLQEELGDLLFHIVMQVQMAREEELFRLGDVISGIYTKIRRRHPHVWDDWQVEDSEDVVANWEAIKAREKGRSESHSILDNIPRTLAALSYSQKMQKRVRRVGFDWPNVEGVVAKVQEEIDELAAASTVQEQEAELGDVLFAVVNLARWLGLDAESALRRANLRFRARFQLLESLATTRGIDLQEADLETMERLWQEAKDRLNQERSSSQESLYNQEKES